MFAAVGEIIMAYLEVTLKVDENDRAAAAKVYQRYKQPFLDTIEAAQSKEWLVRDDDVQVLHGFTNVHTSQNYLSSHLFTQDVVAELSPLLQSAPEIRVYQTP